MYIELERVTKNIKGRQVLNNVSMSIREGEIVGIVGINGAGKTMLFRAISGLVKIDSGKIKIKDQIVCGGNAYPVKLGIMLENVGLWPELNAVENLTRLSNINHRITRSRICQVISEVGLDPNDLRPYKKYSLGMKQRLLIAQAIMEYPELLILDEPSNALDRQGQELIRNILIQHRNRGATILLASHNKQDIDILCDRILNMEGGEIVDEERN